MKVCEDCGEQRSDLAAFCPKCGKASESQMTLIEHLGELRKRLVIAVISVVLTTCGSYFFVDEMMVFVTAQAGKLYFMSPAEGFFSYLKLAVFAGVMLSLPVIIWQAWSFAAPALTFKEKRWALIMVPGSVCLFFTGVVFAYFLIWPLVMKYFLGFDSENLMPMLSLGKYLSFLFSFVLPFGVVFNLPLLLLMLAKMGIIDADFLARYRKPMIVAAFVIGAILTPPDVFSQVMLAIPIILLYEASILVMRILVRK